MKCFTNPNENQAFGLDSLVGKLDIAPLDLLDCLCFIHLHPFLKKNAARI